MARKVISRRWSPEFSDLRRIKNLVNAIDRRSKAAEYTDVDDVWAVFYEIRGICRAAERRARS